MSAWASTPLQAMQWARNGKYPDAWFQKWLSEEANRTAAYKTKCIARFSIPIAAIPGAGGAGSRPRWRFAFHSSPKVRNIWARFYLASSRNTTDSFARLRVETATPTTVGDADYHFGAAGVSSPDTPAFFGQGTPGLKSAGALVDVPTDTDLFGVISDNDNSRLIAACVFETALDLTIANGFLEEQFAMGTPIYDEDRGDMITLLRTQWKRGAAHLFNWSVDVQSTPRTRTSATAINAIDDTSTTVSTATPGWTIDLANRSTVRRVTVPVTMKVRAKQSAGTGLVKLKDSAGTAVATFTINSATEQWWSATANLPASSAKYDLHYESDGINTISLYAASCYQYDA